jgi:hypothetical protein
VVAVLLLSLPMFGQYSGTFAKSGVDVLNSTTSPSPSYDCVSGDNNCFVELTSTEVLTQVTAPFDGTVPQAVNTNGRRLYWDISAQAWDLADDGSLNGKMVRVYIPGGSGFSLAITNEASGNVYYWNTSTGAWNHLGSTAVCVDGAADSIGNLYCIGTDARVYWWNGSAWTIIRSTTTAVTIAANRNEVAIVDTSGNLYVAGQGGASTWTEITSPGAYFATTIGALGLGDDQSFSVLGPSGNVQISHDAGATWTTVDRGGVAANAVANGFSSSSFFLSSGGKVYHLNTIVPQVTMSVSGTCGSACSGNPQVLATYYNSEAANSQFSCPSGWGIWTTGDNHCWHQQPAQTALNATASSFTTNCDNFAPGCGSSDDGNVQTQIEITIVQGGVVVYNNDRSSNFSFQPLWVNQKYHITSSTTGPATPETIFGWHIPGSYYWSGVSVTQWCIGGTLGPNLAPTTTIYYLGAGSTTPSSMPGAYVNVDIVSLIWADATITAAPFINWGTNWKTGIGEGHSFIYTWDNTSAKRGAGGSPTAA